MNSEIKLKKGQKAEDVQYVSSNKPKTVTWEDWLRNLKCAKLEKE